MAQLTSPELASDPPQGLTAALARGRGTVLLTLLDLRYRARRFAVATIGVAVVFALLLLLTGLSQQFAREPAAAVAAIGGDQHWIVRQEAAGPFTSATTLDPAVVPGATPLVIARYSVPAAADRPAVDVVVVGGVDDPRVAEGRSNGPGEAVISAGGPYAVGDTLTIGDRELEVVGEAEDATLFAGVPLLLVDLEEARSIVYEGRPAATTLLASPETRAPAGLRTMSPDEVAADALRPLEQPISSVRLIAGLLWAVAAMVVGAVVYLTSLDRARDVAVLRAVGTPSGWLVVSLLLQAVTLAVVAAVLAAGMQVLIRPAFPLPVHLTVGDLVTLPFVAMAVAALASIGGIRRTLRTDPALAFAGPGA